MCIHIRVIQTHIVQHHTPTLSMHAPRIPIYITHPPTIHDSNPQPSTITPPHHSFIYLTITPSHMTRPNSSMYHSDTYIAISQHILFLYLSMSCIHIQLYTTTPVLFQNTCIIHHFFTRNKKKYSKCRRTHSLAIPFCKKKKIKTDCYRNFNLVSIQFLDQNCQLIS